MQKVPLSQDELVKNQFGCNLKCASMCYRFFIGQAQLNCITSCGCDYFISEIPPAAVLEHYVYVSRYEFPWHAKLGRVWVSKRRIVPIFGSPNHWAVLIEVMGYGFVCVQSGARSDGSIEIMYRNTLRDAALAGGGCGNCVVRTAYYGYTYSFYNIGHLRDYLADRGRYGYSVLFNNCQHLARAVVGWLTGKWVGVFPIENGPDFYP